MPKMRPSLVPNELTVLDNFIKVEECSAILSELQFCYWEPSTVIHRAYDGLRTQLRTDFRSSSTTDQEWFGERLQSLISSVERRLRLEFHARSSHLEKWQATRYGRGGRFDYHLDCGFWEESNAGERIATYLLYLDTPAMGGETHFRALDRIVEARAGRLLAWSNLLPGGGCNSAMIHSGLKVKKGSKTILVTWERERRTKRSS